MLDLTTEFPWWTPADTAALEERTWAMVNALYDHREEACEECADGSPCSLISRIVGEVVEWRKGRETSQRLRWVRLALAHMEPPRPNPISSDRLVQILRGTAP